MGGFALKSKSSKYKVKKLRACISISNLPVIHFFSVRVDLLSVAAIPKQNKSSQVEETLSTDDRTGGQRCDLSTQRTLRGAPGQVKMCGEMLM